MISSKKIQDLLRLLLVVALGLLVSALNFKVNAEAAEVRLNRKQVTIIEGQSYSLKLKHAKKARVFWKTSERSIATVNKGVVKGLKKGTAIITAKYKNKKYRCKVIVKKPYLTAESNTVNVGKRLQISVVGCTDKATWYSSNTEVARVSKKGKVRGISAGEATISARINGRVLKYKILVVASGLSDTPVAEPVKTEIPLSAVGSYYRGSGAGAWGMSFELKARGDFVASFHNTNLGESGDDYKYTIRFCNCIGKFDSIEQINKYTWRMSINECSTDKPIGSVWIEDDCRYIVTNIGFGFGDTVYLYLKGIPRSQLPDYLQYTDIGKQFTADDRLNCNLLYYVDSEMSLYG